MTAKQHEPVLSSKGILSRKMFVIFLLVLPLSEREFLEGREKAVHVPSKTIGKYEPWK
jgi:hypothetical protein